MKNNAVINKDVSQKALLSAYQQEIQKLRQQLSSQGGGSLTEEELQALTKEKEAAQKEKVLLWICCNYCRSFSTLSVVGRGVVKAGDARTTLQEGSGRERTLCTTDFGS